MIGYIYWNNVKDEPFYYGSGRFKSDRNKVLPIMVLKPAKDKAKAFASSRGYRIEDISFKQVEIKLPNNTITFL